MPRRGKARIIPSGAKVDKSGFTKLKPTLVRRQTGVEGERVSQSIVNRSINADALIREFGPVDRPKPLRINSGTVAQRNTRTDILSDLGKDADAFKFFFARASKRARTAPFATGGFAKEIKTG